MARVQYVAHGEFAIGGREGDVISATLGSCIAVCLFDETASVGGMNHILLPGSAHRSETQYGYADMERLINALIKRGAARGHLVAKAFGGAAMLGENSDIGQRNAAFVLDYLQREAIPCLAKSIGGVQARQVKFFPRCGNVKHRFVSAAVARAPKRALAVNDVELF